jgi:hypothetical protein
MAEASYHAIPAAKVLAFHQRFQISVVLHLRYEVASVRADDSVSRSLWCHLYVTRSSVSADFAGTRPS